ncbi:MAG TPA: hypothetical protein VF698_09235, partial [Thermoanaerobaculia bacterium]
KSPAATELAGRLVQIRSIAPSLLRAGDLLAANADSADAHFAIGFAYLRTERFNDAKNEYQTAQRLATAAGNAELAQRSEIQAAAATAQAGDRKTAMTSLEKVTRSPATPLTEAEAWLILGHLRKSGGDAKGSLDAYSRAASRAPQGSELQRIASSLVARRSRGRAHQLTFKRGVGPGSATAGPPRSFSTHGRNDQCVPPLPSFCCSFFRSRSSHSSSRSGNSCTSRRSR